MGDHSRISIAPSSAYMWVYCHGAPLMQSKYPDSSRAGEDGDASHWAASEVLGHIKLPSDLSFDHVSTLKGFKAPNGIILTEEHIDHAYTYVNDVTAIALQRGSLHALHIEEIIHAPTIHPKSKGKVDGWLYDPVRREIIIWDYKFGYTLVDVFENWQAINYAVGIIDGLAIPDQGLTVTMRIVQPRPYHPDGSIREWSVPAVDLRPFANRLHMAAANALGGDPTLRSGDHCKYCRARHDCPAGAKAALAAMDYAGEARISELPLEALGLEIMMLQRGYKAIESRLTGLEAQAISLLKSGKNIQGWGLEPGKGRKAWCKPPGEVFALGDLLGVDLRRPEEPCTPTQAINKGMDKKLIGAYSHTPTTGLKLVRDDGSKAREVFKDAPVNFKA